MITLWTATNVAIFVALLLMLRNKTPKSEPEEDSEPEPTKGTPLGYTIWCEPPESCGPTTDLEPPMATYLDELTDPTLRIHVPDEEDNDG